MAVISPEKGAKQIYRHHKHKWWWFQKIWSWIQWHLLFVDWPEESSARVAGDRSKVKSGWSCRVANGARGKDVGWFHRWLALAKQIMNQLLKQEHLLIPSLGWFGDQEGGKFLFGFHRWRSDGDGSPQTNETKTSFHFVSEGVTSHSSPKHFL